MLHWRLEKPPMTDVPEKTIKAAKEVADRLEQRGHREHASKIRAALAHGHMLRTALRDACQVVLTAIEAIDPVSATMVEELRMKVDALLMEKRGPA
jgi:hypothetical protein